MNDERIFQKLDSIEGQGRELLVAVTQLQEQIKDVPDLKQRVQALERWKWTAMGALGMSGASILSQAYTALKGA